MPTLNLNASPTLRIGSTVTPRVVFLFAGQSNMSAYSPMGVLRGSGLTSNPGSPGTAPDYVPGYMQTAANEWTGSPAASIDSGVQYPYPTDANSACLYDENTRGPDATYNVWGSHVKQSAQFNSGGALGDGGSYGLELSFLQSHLAAYPATPIAAIKVASGGTALRGDWLPGTVAMGLIQAVAGSSLTLSASDQGTTNGYTGAVVRMLSGAAAGQERAISSYNSTTKVATLASAFSPAPASGDSYGVQRQMLGLLRRHMELGAARLAASGGPWRWGGLVWMQGESGAHQASGVLTDDSQYLSDARALFAYVRSITRPDLPVMIGRIGDNWGWEATPNPYLAAEGYPYAAIDASTYGRPASLAAYLEALPARDAGDQTSRENKRLSAVTRRATQATLGADSNCVMFSNDGYPVRPPYTLTAAETDLDAFHWGGPGNLAAGERAFAAYQTVRN